MFKPIPVEGAVDANIVNRIQANIASEFAAIGAPNGIGVTPIASSKQLTTYQVQSGDRYIVVDATGGPITISFPTPGNQQVVSVLRADSSKNAITLSYPTSTDPKKGNTTQLLVLPLTLLNTGNAWLLVGF